MSFFKDFKEDLSQAVNELMPEETAAPAPAPVVEEPVASIGQDELASMLNNIESLVAEPTPAPVAEPVAPVVPEPAPVPVQPVFAEPTPAPAAPVAPVAPEPVPVQPVFAEPAPAPAAPVTPVFAPEPTVVKEEKLPVAPVFGEPNTAPVEPINVVKNLREMETGIIIAGMVVNGDITADGNLDVQGTVKGNIAVEGKLQVTGTIEGNSNAEEVFADGAKIIGEIKCNGSVKIGESSVVRGNVTATAAVIAGAVKGDIDVQGPVILDSTAMIMGNIKSKSIQINNGAAIEGLCSQCYADVSPASFFGEEKPAPKASKSKAAN